jgi:hypothetical protein
MGRPSSETRTGAAVHDLQEQLAHGGVDRVAHEIGVQRLQNGLAGQNLGGHGGGMGHAGAAEGLDQRLFDDPVFDVQGQLARALLRRAPADAVGQAGDVRDFLGLHPLPLSGIGAGPWWGPSPRRPSAPLRANTAFVRPPFDWLLSLAL